MTIAFFSNYFNHHQKPLADALNSEPYVKYTFVATTPIPEFRKALGYQQLNADYVLDASASEENKKIAEELALEADVAIFMGGAMEHYEIPRLKRKKLTFEYSERRLKRGYINLLSPNLIRHQYMYWRYGRSAPLYMLCSSAYTADDYYFMRSFINRCYKWGYFTKVEDFPLETLRKLDVSSIGSTPHIMWCARFLCWKHPELPIKLARRLKEKGLNFKLDMFGSGEELERTKRLATQLDVNGEVSFLGNLPNEQILEQMQEHDIFLVTSDRHEGWGAVLNEAMSNGCAVVASNLIGSVPFLIEDGVNGLIFKSEDIDDLEKKVEILLINTNFRHTIQVNAIKTLRESWAPTIAAKRLSKLINYLSHNAMGTPFHNGPCSMAK